MSKVLKLTASCILWGTERIRKLVIKAKKIPKGWSLNLKFSTLYIHYAYVNLFINGKWIWSNIYYFCNLSWKNASTESVFHLSIPSSSTTLRFSSISLIVGSMPRIYLTVRRGNCCRRSDFTNAVITNKTCSLIY